MRKLFLYNLEGEIVECNVLCLFDFYVHHSVQRLGHGKILIDKILRFYNVPAYKLAFDTPNQKLLNFLYKHFSIKDYIKQSNNLIVYNDFFIGRLSEKHLNYNYALKHQFYNKRPEEKQSYPYEKSNNTKYFIFK